MMDDLVEWLRAQLDVEERSARELLDENAASRVTGLASTLWDEEDADAQRVLRDIDAKRRILNLTSFDAQFPDSDGGYDSACEDVIKLLALPYDQRPGYQEAWRP